MMTETQKRKMKPIHPGEVLREVFLPAIDLSDAELASTLGISRGLLCDIVNEHAPISPKVAVRLSAMFGKTAQHWMNIQIRYDIWHAERDTDIG